MEQRTDEISIAQWMLTAAAAVVLIAGLRAAEALILPVLFAAMLSVLAAPGVGLLTQRRVPKVLAVAIVVVGLVVPLAGIGAIIASSLGGLEEATPRYAEAYQGFMDSVAGLLDRLPAWLRRDPAELEYGGLLGSVLEWVSSSLSSVVVVLGNIVVVGLVLTFVLLEASTFPDKLELAFDRGQGPRLKAREATRRIARYLAVKTAFSTVTGILCWGVCVVLGIELAGLWGLLAFMLNYIPNVGSIIAVVPPLLLALVGPSWLTVFWLAGAYLAINFVLGNLLEPRFMGRSLGLSPLVVVLSLVFWTWMWGPAGALLSGPLTVIVKLSLEADPDTRWLAVLLGPGEVAQAEVTQSLAAVEVHGPAGG